jgi:hypothetical protein
VAQRFNVTRQFSSCTLEALAPRLVQSMKRKIVCAPRQDTASLLSQLSDESSLGKFGRQAVRVSKFSMSVLLTAAVLALGATVAESRKNCQTPGSALVPCMSVHLNQKFIKRWRLPCPEEFGSLGCR